MPYATISNQTIEAIGLTADESNAAARRDLGANCPWLDDLQTLPCTPALYDDVETRGGAISWCHLSDGTLCTLDEYADAIQS